MAIFITGDTHANFSRFEKGKFPEQDDLSKSDSVIICGDYAEKIIMPKSFILR